jgi:predicted nucleic acid-binding protein
VDSNIFLATVIPDERMQKAYALIEYIEQKGLSITAPTLFRYEVVAVIRRQFGRGLINFEEANHAITLLLAKSILFSVTDKLLQRGFEIANQFNFPTAYDSQYLAVAEQLGCEFWTIDKRIVDTVAPTWAWVKWLGNFTG